MIDAVGPAGADHGQLVGAFGDVRQEIGDGQAAPAAVAEGPPGREEWVRRDLATGGDAAEALGQRLAGQALEVGLGVERLRWLGPPCMNR